MKYDLKQIFAYRNWSKILGDMFRNTHKKDILIALKWLTSLTVSHSFALRNNVLFRYFHPIEAHNAEPVKCHPSVWYWLLWGQEYRLDGPHQINYWQCSQIHWHTIWIRDCFRSPLWLVFSHNVIHQRYHMYLVRFIMDTTATIASPIFIFIFRQFPKEVCNVVHHWMDWLDRYTETATGIELTYVYRIMFSWEQWRVLWNMVLSRNTMVNYGLFYIST